MSQTIGTTVFLGGLFLTTLALICLPSLICICITVVLIRLFYTHTHTHTHARARVLRLSLGGGGGTPNKQSNKPLLLLL